MIPLDAVAKIVATYELPSINTQQDEIFGALRFVVQILQLPSGKYAPRVLRKDRVQIEPAYFKSRKGLVKKMTTEMLVPDDSYDWESLVRDTEKQALSGALQELASLLKAP